MCSFFFLAIVLSVVLRFTASDYPFGILWPLYCLSFFDLLLLITPLVSSNFAYSRSTNWKHILIWIYFRSTLFWYDIYIVLISNEYMFYMLTLFCFKTRYPIIHFRREFVSVEFIWHWKPRECNNSPLFPWKQKMIKASKLKYTAPILLVIIYTCEPQIG